MTPVRRPLAGLLALFVGALAFDRLALSAAAERTIDTPAYGLALSLVVAPLFVRGFRRTRFGTYLAASGAAVVVLQVLAGHLTGDPYQAILETAFVVLAAALAHRLAAALTYLDAAVNSKVFGESPALALDGRKAANEILGEMARSRRHGRPLSVTVLAPDEAGFEIATQGAAEEVQRALRTRYIHSKIAHTIAQQLRRSDLLFEDPATGHFVVLSPETGSEGTALLIERIGRAVSPTKVNLSAGHATFPDHALTFEQLVERAQDQMIPAESAAATPGREGAA